MTSLSRIAMVLVLAFYSPVQVIMALSESKPLLSIINDSSGTATIAWADHETHRLSLVASPGATLTLMLADLPVLTWSDFDINNPSERKAVLKIVRTTFDYATTISIKNPLKTIACTKTTQSTQDHLLPVGIRISQEPMGTSCTATLFFGD